jgi:transposase
MDGGGDEQGGKCAVFAVGLSGLGRSAHSGAQPMLSIGASTKVFLRPGSTDLRLGFEGLYQLVRTKLDQDPLSGHVFAFCNQSKTRLKLLTWCQGSP